MPIAPHSRSEFDLAEIGWDRVDATDDAEIARQAAEDPETAPVFTVGEILAARRHIAPDAIEDVLALRTRLGLSQHAFATHCGFSVDAIRQYRSHRRVPSGPARTLLRVIAREPDAVSARSPTVRDSKRAAGRGHCHPAPGKLARHYSGV